MNTILQQYFLNRLRDYGYGDALKVEYSLSYCQGDGVAFYGKLDEKNFDQLFRRFLHEYYQATPNLDNTLRPHFFQPSLDEMLTQWEAKWLPVVIDLSDDRDFCLERNSGGYHYSHFNTMDLYIGMGNIEHVLEDEDALAYWCQDSPESAISMEEVRDYCEVYRLFSQWLDEDIRDTSKQLEQLGYRVIEQSTCSERYLGYQFYTKNYVVELHASPNDFYVDPVNWVWNYGDMQTSAETESAQVDALINHILDNKQRIVNVEIKVSERYTALELATTAVDSVQVSKDDHLFKSVRSWLLPDVIQDARLFVSRCSHNLRAA